MTLPELATALADLAACTCDDEAAKVLKIAAGVMAGAKYHGPCLCCADRAAEVQGYCRPCYQRHRRATCKQ